MASNNLHTLIHSLTKSEKTYFKKFTSIHGSHNENNYLKLFSTIEKQKVYNELAIKNTFRNEKFIKQLHVTKDYLYKLILKSMRNYNSHLSANNVLKGHLSDIYYLIGKRLYNNTLKEINFVKTLAYKSERYIELLEIFDIEKLIIRRINSSNQLEMLDKIHEEELFALKVISIEKKLSWFYRKMTTTKRMENITDRNNKNFSKLTVILQEAQILKTTNNFSKKAEILYHQILVAYYFSVPDYINAYTYSKKLVSLIESSSLLLTEEPMIYITSFLNFIELNLNLQNYSEFWNNIRKLQLLSAKIKKNLSELDKSFIKLSLLNEEITCYNLTGQFQKCINLITLNYQDIRNEDKKIDPVLKIMLYLNISIAYFSIKDFETSLEWINKILNDKQLSLVKPYFNSAIYLNLFIHFELGNYDLLDSNITSVNRQFSEKGETEIIIIEFMRKLIKSEDSDKAFIYSQFKKKILALNKELNIDENKTLFSIPGWIESKILEL